MKNESVTGLSCPSLKTCQAGRERTKLWMGSEMNPVMTARNDRMRSDPVKTRLPAFVAHIRYGRT